MKDVQESSRLHAVLYLYRAALRSMRKGSQSSTTWLKDYAYAMLYCANKELAHWLTGCEVTYKTLTFVFYFLERDVNGMISKNCKLEGGVEEKVV